MRQRKKLFLPRVMVAGGLPSAKTDAEPPWIQCPADIVAETDERRGTANVSWNVPNATDNSKEEVVVQVKPVYSPPQLFPIGKETITYIATDRSGNQANCSFTVTVIDTEPPVIDRCRSPPTVQATDGEAAVVWEVPQFSDNSGISVAEATKARLSRGGGRTWMSAIPMNGACLGGLGLPALPPWVQQDR
ncbi:sushi, von Willebrand factor type A, EGF and pentraxin domain-containing protein 1 [Lates japonicus]|uniref:Sushi, von Willebrand factor type A, EGF and pentraxin domain-containing protein 1 n=1 Tax=Lates japonicus TaxID=270547 RepID=A0AAD3R3P6_LATJO|nr:sushi, von Willebrand factor type A, EGF and pentraxin domain-containing protein 1 [Lates japonicus]